MVGVGIELVKRHQVSVEHRDVPHHAIVRGYIFKGFLCRVGHRPFGGGTSWKVHPRWHRKVECVWRLIRVASTSLACRRNRGRASQIWGCCARIIRECRRHEWRWKFGRSVAWLTGVFCTPEPKRVKHNADQESTLDGKAWRVKTCVRLFSVKIPDLRQDFSGSAWQIIILDGALLAK